MAEQEHGISQTPPQPSEASNVFENSVSDFDEKTMRRCKPGCKRLFLTLTVFVSFLCGYPFLMKSIEIYRSPLPFRDIDALSRSIESTPLQFPCHFQAIFIGFDQNSSFKSNVDDLSVLISNKMRLFINKNSPCGSCSDNFTISVVLDSAKECMRKQIGGKGEYEWQCGVIREVDFDTDEESVDDMLETVLGSVRKVYSVVVVKRDNGGQIRAVVGKHQHAWVVGWIDEIEAVLRVAEIFVKVFINGGKEVSSIRGEFMPIGADGKIVLSFNLLNADPRDWIYEWDFKNVDEMLLAPVIEALGPIANISVESQVLYHTPKSLLSHWNDNMKGYTVSTKDLPFFVNSNEWHLDTSIAAGGRSKVLQIAVYIPSAKECPLLLQLPDGEISATNGFISPMWGGVIIWNPPDCLSSRGRGRRPSRHTVPLKDLQKIFEVFMGQLRQLFGLKSENMLFGISGSYSLLASDKGFSKWELDVLARQHTCFNLLSCATTLASLSRLVQSLPRMIIMDDIGKQVKYSLEAAKLAQSNASAGIYDASAVSSKHARSLAEDAFFHPSIMSVSYYSFEHCFAVYSPSGKGKGTSKKEPNTRLGYTKWEKGLDKRPGGFGAKMQLLCYARVAADNHKKSESCLGDEVMSCCHDSLSSLGLF